MDIEKLRKEMTREEFLNDTNLTNTEGCPNEYELKEYESCTCKDITCKECWRNAVKDIKFKDDIEVKKLSKELNIIEAMKMPIGTEFTVVHDRKGTNIQKATLCINYDNKFLEWESGKKLNITSDNIFGTFIPIQQPVSFMEAIKAYSKGKTIEVNTKSYSTLYKPAERNSMGDELLDEDGEVINLKEILEGKWYIQEDNAND